MHLSKELKDISEFRVAHDKSLRCAQHICDAQAERDKTLITGLKTELTVIADDIPNMSAQKNDILWCDAAKLLDEEVLRESHTDSLIKWQATYRAKRNYISNVIPDHFELVTPEEEVCTQAQDLLCTHLSDLTPDDEYHRAELILEQIEIRRRALLAQFAMCPLQSVRAATMVTLGTMLAMVNALLAAAEVGHIAIEYVINTPQILQQKKRLSIIQKRCRLLIEEAQMLKPVERFSSS